MPRLSKRLSFIQANTELSSGLSRMLGGGVVQRKKLRIEGGFQGIITRHLVVQLPRPLNLHGSGVSGSVKCAWPQVVD